MASDFDDPMPDPFDEDELGLPDIDKLIGIDDFIKSLLTLKVLPQQRPTIHGYFQEHPAEKNICVEKMKELESIILQAAENGYIDTVRKAIPVLRKVQKTLLVTATGLNFCEGRGSGTTRSKQFYTPLLHACENKSKPREMVELLLHEGAKVDYYGKEYKENQKGHKKLIGSRLNAMHVACIQGRADIVSLLISRAEENMLKKPLKDILNAKSKDHWTPLMYAVKEGHTEVVKVLFEQDSLDILARNRKGHTALHIAGLHSRLDCLKVIHTKLSQEKLTLMDKNENPYLHCDKKGHSVLHRICKGPKGPDGTDVPVQALKWLFESLPHLDVLEILNQGTEEEGYSMLLLACDNGNKDLVEYLLAKKAVDVSSTTKDGKTGLHLAALHDYPDIAELLLEHGVLPTIQDKERNEKHSEKSIGEDTALHIAVRKSSFDVEQKIRSHSEVANVLTIRNKLGETPDTVKIDEIIPLEIRRLGQDAIQRFRQLLRAGKKKKMPRCNLIALGEQRVGKTSLLCLLMGEPFVENRDSTRGIDSDDVDANMVTEREVSSEKWTHVNPMNVSARNRDQFANSVAEDFQSDFQKESAKPKPPQASKLNVDIEAIEKYLNEMEEKAKSTEETSLNPKASHAKHTKRSKGASLSAGNPKRLKTQPKLPIENAANQIKPAIHQPQPVEPTIQQPRQERPVVQPPSKQSAQPTMTSVQPSDTTAGLQSNLDSVGGIHTHRIANPGRQISKIIVATAKGGSNIKEPVLQYKTLDFAGQPEYRPMHHCFIVRRAIYLLVFNFQIVKEAITSPNKENKLALEEIQYWMNSIHTHIHKLEPEPSTYKRVILVGTHRGVVKDTKDADMQIVNDHLRHYIEQPPLLNNMYRANSNVWFAAVENSIDGTEETARQESGARSLQETIRAAWNELPFKDELYPSTWLLFEAYLNNQRGTAYPIVSVTSIKYTARERFGIGVDEDEDAELALGFFHDTGTIVYPKKHPALYLTDEEKNKLDDLVLLDPSWLTRMMRNVMELKAGKGSKLSNDEKLEIEKTGCAKLGTLKKACWNDLSEVDFVNLILMLQSFCLIFPLPPSEAPTSASSSSTHDSPSQNLTDTVLDDTQLDTFYLIPSKLSLCTPISQPCNKFKANFSFVFDFGCFLPEQVYHRLLCLMLKTQSKESTVKSKGEFTAQYFIIKGVEQCNWMVEKINCKLHISVLHPKNHTVPPSTYVEMLHLNYLAKICNDEGSSLQGLRYEGGPEHDCCTGKKSVVAIVAFPVEAKCQPWKCEDCLEVFDDIDMLLDPKCKKSDTSSKMNGTVEDAAHPKRSETASTHNTAGLIVLAEPHSNVHVHQAPEPMSTAGSSVGTHTTQLQLPESQNVQTSTQATSEDTHQLCIDDLQKVLEELVDVTEWRRLGLALGLRHPTLEQLKETQDKKYEMLCKWLDKVDGCEPSWEKLAEALRNPTVGHRNIADLIGKKYNLNA